MNIRLWRIGLFVAVVVGATLLAFPNQEDMVDLLLRSNRLEAAWEVAEKALSEGEAHATMLATAARISQSLGEPGRAIDLLRRALERRPDDLEFLGTLGQYLVWDLRPAEALDVYGRMTEVDPVNRAALRRVANLSRYLGQADRESLAVARLVELPPPPDGDAVAFLEVLDQPLRVWAAERLAKGPAPLRDMALTRLYTVQEQILMDLEDQGRPDLKQYAMDCLDGFVSTNRLAEGKAFAGDLDRTLGWGVQTRLNLATVMRWSDLEDQALAWVLELDREMPRNREILAAQLEMARQFDKPQLALSALRQLKAMAPSDPEVLSILADAALAAENYQEAVDSLTALSEVRKDDPEVLRRLLFAALASGRKPLLLGALDRAAAATDPELLRLRAQAFLAAELPEQALGVLRPLAQARPPQAADVELFLSAAGYAGDREAILEGARIAAEALPDDPEAAWNAGRSLLGVGQPGLAYPLLRRAALADPTEEKVGLMLDAAGFAAIPAQMEEAAADAARLRPGDPLILAKAGEVLLWIDKPVLAFPIFLRAAQASGGERASVLKMLETAGFSGDKRQLREALDALARLRPADPTLAKAEAEARMALPDFAGAAAAWERHLKAHPRDAAAQRRLAEAYGLSNQGEKGYRIMARLAEAAGRKDKDLLELAAYAEAAGLNDEAFALFDELRRRRPSDARIRGDLIRLAQWTNRQDVAAALLAEVSDETPADYPAALAAARALADAGKPDRGLTYAERALGLRPDAPEALRLTADLASYAGRPERAVTAWEQMDRLGLLTSGERLRLGEAYVVLRKGDRALPHLEPILKAPTLAPNAGLVLAQAYVLAGRPAEADRLYRRLAADGRDPAYLLRAGVEALQNGSSEAARTAFDKVLRQRPDDPTALKGMALAAAALSDPRRAQSLLERYLKLRPDDAQARFLLGELYGQADRGGSAAREFGRTLKLLNAGKPGPTAPARP